MSHAPPQDGPAPHPVNSIWRGIVFAFGAVGLIGAMLTDAIAVIGRQIRMPFLGSVEMAQICVVMIAGSALVAATLLREHANVRVVTERLPPNVRSGAEAFAHLTNAIFFALLFAGSGWIAWELLGGAERTELLGFPVGLLRGFWLCCAALCVILLLKHAFTRSKPQ